jgi:predicted nucleic acid-binding protein
VPFVADNSVVIAWFARSQATPYSDRFFGKLTEDEVIVPAVWPYEFANAIAVLERRRIITATVADEIIGKAAKLVTRIDTPPASPQILLGLARRHGLSAYDAAYLELAQRLAVPLAAKDSPLASVARSLNVLGD